MTPVETLKALYEQAVNGSLEWNKAFARIDELRQAGAIDSEEVNAFDGEIQGWLAAGNPESRIFPLAWLNYRAAAAASVPPPLRAFTALRVLVTMPAVTLDLLPLRIQVLDEVLGGLEDDQNPEWAAARRVELGNALVQSPLGPRADNLERAVAAYETALKVYTYEAFPEEWAVAQGNLGTAYAERIRGEPADNLEQAIASFEAVLTVYTREAFPRYWAETQNNLGNAFRQRIRGERADNLEQAIASFEAALTVYNRETFPEQWASTQISLGAVFGNRVRGERADNLERAVAAFKAALAVRTREAFPEEWAMIQHNLGNTFHHRISGKRADNLEQAIAAFEAALEIRIREAFPRDWAATQNDLGVAYRERVRGERADNLEQAIASFEATLTVFTREAFPRDWAGTQNNLGDAYADRIRGKRADNLEQAIASFEATLTVFTREAFPRDWAKIQNNLGNAFRKRIRGERADNLEQAIASYKEALEVFTRKSFPEERAMTQNNVGNAYAERIRGEPADNLERAIAAYEAALTVHTREAFPRDWAKIQNNLGLAYSDRIRGERADNLERAIAACEAALRVYTYEAFPRDWAGTQNNLGDAFRKRIRGERASNLERAVAAYGAASCIFTTDTHPRECRRVQTNLGLVLLQGSRWQQAWDACQAGLKAAHHLLGIASDTEARGVEIGASDALYANAAYALARLDQPAEALVVLEQGRAQELRHQTSRDQADLSEVPLELQETYRNATQWIRELEAEWRQPPEHRAKDLSERQRQAQSRFDRLVEQVRAIKPDFLREDVTLDDVRTVLSDPKVALVDLAITEVGTLALILRQDDKPPESVWIDTLTRRHLWNEWLLKRDEASGQLVGGWLWGFVTMQSKLLRMVWRRKMEHQLRRMGDELIVPIAQRLQGVERVILVAHEGLHLLPLESALFQDEDGVETTLAERAAVSVTPSALFLQKNGWQDHAPSRSRLLVLENPLDDPWLQFTPIEVERLIDHVGAENVIRLPGVEASLPGLLKNLPAAKLLHFSCHGAYDWGNPELSGLELHRGEGEPSVAGGQPGHLTLRHLYQRQVNLSGVQLVTMSACETGMTEVRERAEEGIGLPGGFLGAGVPVVVATLWSVNDASTAFLMSRFYSHLLPGGLPPDQALQRARKETREVTWRGILEELGEEPVLAGLRVLSANALAESLSRGDAQTLATRPFESPYYWAAFQVWGEGWRRVNLTMST